MSQDVETKLSEAFVGRTCTVIRREFDWVLFFEVHRALVLSTPWRIVIDGRIAHAEADHGQWFGHAEPIDGAARANQRISGQPVSRIRLHPQLADLTLIFTNGATFEVFNGSSGYEAWQAEFPVAASEGIVIGLGGGGFSVSSSARTSNR